MNRLPEIESSPTKVVNILSVSPIEEDHYFWESTAGQPEWFSYISTKCAVQRSYTLDSARATLRRSHIPVVVCECDLLPGAWIDILDEAALLPAPPLLIVTSRLADERLWAEAINLGAFDVLAKPFNAREVMRVLASAWRHGVDLNQVPFKRPASRAENGAGLEDSAVPGSNIASSGAGL